MKPVRPQSQPNAGVHGSPPTIREDLEIIASMVPPRSRVLDIGCGDGSLLSHLESTLHVRARGLELNQSFVNACVRRGLSVVQGNADADLVDFPSRSFDTVILSQTIQATHHPRTVLNEMLRIGSQAIISFPNFGHWRVRLHLAAKGTMPVTPRLPDPWYATQNVRLCTIRDFVSLCHELNVRIRRIVPIAARQFQLSSRRSTGYVNLFAEQAIFVLSSPFNPSDGA